MALLTACLALGTEDSGDLELDQLLQALVRQLGDWLTSGAVIQ